MPTPVDTLDDAQHALRLMVPREFDIPTPLNEQLSFRFLPAGHILGAASVVLCWRHTVIALPINLIAGFLGMNVGGVPFRYDLRGFWIVTLIALSLTSLAAWLIFRLRQD